MDRRKNFWSKRLGYKIVLTAVVGASFQHHFKCTDFFKRGAFFSPTLDLFFQAFINFQRRNNPLPFYKKITAAQAVSVSPAIRTPTVRLSRDMKFFYIRRKKYWCYIESVYRCFYFSTTPDPP
jgi:hypothetical protein